jgi:tetratricopeptide (TPR) repeat protein
LIKKTIFASSKKDVMSTQKENTTIENVENEVSSAKKSALQQSSFLERIGNFYEGNAKYFAIGIGAVLVVVFGYIGYQKFIVTPANIESAQSIYAGESLFVDEQNFEAVVGQDTLGNEGLVSAANKHEGYAGGNIANYEMGISYLNIGEHDNAIKSLEKASFEDENIETLRIGAIGDAYAGKEEWAKALNQYTLAYERKPKNQMTAPLYLYKIATIKEIEGKYDDAAKYYTDLIENFPGAANVSDAKKYRVLAQNKVAVFN